MTHNVTDDQLIDQTVEYLQSLPNRVGMVEKDFGGREDFYCMYRGPHPAAPTCAAGKWIEDEFYTPELENSSVECEEVAAALRSSGIKESQLPILKRLQDFHDCADNWGGSGLSSCGKRRLDTISSTLRKTPKESCS